MTRVDDTHCTQGLWQDIFNPPWNFCADNDRLDETTRSGDSGKAQILQELWILSSVTLKNMTGYLRYLLKMPADHATSLLPNPIVVWTNESTRNMSWVDYFILCLLVMILNNVTVQGGCVSSPYIVDKRLCSCLRNVFLNQEESLCRHLC